MRSNIDIKQYDFYRQLEKLPFIEKIILYGSRARGDNRDRSDIDIAIVCPSATRDEWVRVLDIVDEADTLLKIDCVRLDELGQGSRLGQEIIKDGVQLYVKS